MKLPGAEKATIEIQKLEDYCLSKIHPRGKHKAIVFKSSLDITSINSHELKQEILKAVVSENATFTGEDIYGKRFVVDINIRKFDKQAVIRTCWIIKQNEGFPRLTSCYVKT